MTVLLDSTPFPTSTLIPPNYDDGRMIIAIRYGKDPVRGWTTQQVFAVEDKFYKRMSKLMDFKHALEYMLLTTGGEELAKKLKADDGFYLTDARDTKADTTYFPTEKTDPYPTRDKAYECGYCNGVKHGAEYTWKKDFTGQIYLAEQVEYKMGKKHGEWNKYWAPNERFLFLEHCADSWKSLRLESEALHAGKTDIKHEEDADEIGDKTYYQSGRHAVDPTVEIKTLSFSAEMKNDHFAICSTWFENGQLESWGEYKFLDEKQGAMNVGEHYRYHWNGQLASLRIYPDEPETREIFKNDQVIGRIPKILYQAHFNENGEIIHCVSHEGEKPVYHCGGPS